MPALASYRITSGEERTRLFRYWCPPTALNPLTEALAQAHIKPFMLDIKPLAISRAAATGEALVISLEKNYADIAVVYAGIPRVIHSFIWRTAPIIRTSCQKWLTD